MLACTYAPRSPDSSSSPVNVRIPATDKAERAWDCPVARRLARYVGGEVTYDPGHTPGARFVISLPTG